MRFKRFIFLTLPAMLVLNSVFSQSKDTIVIYEYVHITDTVWLESNTKRDTVYIDLMSPIENATLIIDTLNKSAEMHIFSSGRSATIPINNIILSDNNLNLNSMKKITFLGITFLALSNSLIAQPDNTKNIGLYVRGNYGSQSAHYYEEEALNTNYNQSTDGASVEATAVFGVKGNLPLNSFLSFSPRLSYTHIRGLRPKSYTIYDDKIITHYSATETSKFYFLSTDFLLNYYLPFGKNTNYRLFGGLRTDFLVKQNSGIDLTDPNYKGFKKVMLNYVGGIGFDFGKRVFLELEYSNHINNFVNTDYMWVKYGAVSMNLGCYLF
ncbi:MAG: outer membrane beta-barrel protein [Prolixibacteraceae bacterium]|nr:outer membrane beta-barrel protein [Prolixibacteraceae bacterium]